MLTPRSVPPGTGAIFGRITVHNFSTDVTEKCGFVFTDGEAKIGNGGLQDDGWIFIAIKAGRVRLDSIACALGGPKEGRLLGPAVYIARHRPRGLVFDNPGGGKIAYFGHIEVDMRSSAKGPTMATIFGGALGNSLASIGAGKHASLEIANRLDEAKREFVRRYSASRDALRPTVALAGGKATIATARARTSASPRVQPVATALRAPSPTEPLIARVTMDQVKMTLSAPSAGNPQPIRLQLQRYVPEPELAGCVELEVTLDGQAHRYPLTHQSEPVGAVTRETVETFLDADHIQAMVRATELELTACTLRRRFTTRAGDTLASFAAALRAASEDRAESGPRSEAAAEPAFSAPELSPPAERQEVLGP